MKFSCALKDLCSLLITIPIIISSSTAFADSRDQAKRIHDRLAASPPSEAVLTSMASKIAAGDSIGAAMEAMDDPGFYNIFLKNYITPWSNTDGTVYAPLNDYTATVIGIIRDDVSFREILTGDVTYVGTSSALPAYSQTNNDHYAAYPVSRDTVTHSWRAEPVLRLAD